MSSAGNSQQQSSDPESRNSDLGSVPEEGPRQVLQTWISAVQERDPEAAVALYAEEGMAFWGTFGDHCRTSRAQAREYFERFLDVSSLECRLGETHWRGFGAQLALATGDYVFRIKRRGEASAVETRARFTFAFRGLPGGPWQIVEHHSSLFPEGGF